MSPPPLPDPTRLTATALGRAFAQGSADPVAVCETLLARAAAQSSPIYLALTPDRARAEAQAAAARHRAGAPLSALDGVPVGWKDLIDLAGTVTTAASDLLRDAPRAARDAPIVAHATLAGMVSLGKLNLSEFAYSALGLNPHYGTPVNPRDPVTQRAPGGSSSGSAVAVAAGLLPCAIGSDTGGSIRVPAAFTGIVGYKSSAGRIDKTGVFALSDTLDTIGPLARSVEDCVALDAILRGAPVSVRPRDPATLQIFVPETYVLDDLDPGVAANFDAALGRLAQAGATITRGPLPLLAEAARLAAAHGTLTAAESFHEHRARLDGPDRARIDPRVVARIEVGRTMTAHDLITLHRARARMFADLAHHDLIAMPTTPLTAPEIAPLEADPALFHRTNLRAIRNTFIGNFLDLPGLAIPNGTDQGLPTSFLLCAPSGRDDALLGAGLGAEHLIRQSPEGETDQ